MRPKRSISKGDDVALELKPSFCCANMLVDTQLSVFVLFFVFQLQEPFDVLNKAAHLKARNVVRDV